MYSTCAEHFERKALRLPIPLLLPFRLPMNKASTISLSLLDTFESHYLLDRHFTCTGPSFSLLGTAVACMEKTQATAEHPLTSALSSPTFFKLPSHGPSYPWQTRTVVYAPKNSFHITCYNLRHLPFELSHLTEEECVVPGVSGKNENSLTCICNSMFSSKPPLLGSSTLIPHSSNPEW